ncbi:GNAT family N-acetyltransferase [Cellulomonas fimi]|uniref:GCN5-related N-acetyltransferase n=1 Tax=Cellulomonas fimi (strain ATCC 484 / DSM 20113 / JCM 1341 / CCUG 24087 / LMG 16345 / NBRC 15513 / NCIMB 8980 / NCTC 7547 / NRS-133) TaxID=590998 RepID=F4H745_CELFA|nr:GNAT family N-acetyltransferase [Cellulomonas fimi]AEE45679.1 GCN5-related N-acetyltransferase [Cellulomonas fimi ATCC 484]NNH07404.1 GNAT family N-acetyltransferase [Cellulomonas fimi]VEH30267.1 Acetyltransferase (GNAT) family [Cellulomonas fimi]
MSAPGPTADVSVRPAVPGDEGRIARVQLAAWRLAHADALGPAALDLVDEEAVRGQWAAAIGSPPAGGFHVLVACDGPAVVGVASVAPVPPPGDDPTAAPGGVVLALEVDPVRQRQGHGSRLLAAAVDLLRADGADQVTTWVLDGDPAREQFLASCGLGPDGATRELASGTDADGSARVVREHRWSAAI